MNLPKDLNFEFGQPSFDKLRMNGGGPEKNRHCLLFWLQPTALFQPIPHTNIRSYTSHE
jgi:hypothetical protein